MEVAATGPESELRLLLKHLYRGPSAARVASVAVAWNLGHEEALQSRFEVLF